MTVCKHVLYSGQVQGVGFRFATQRLAEHFQVAGYVRNLANGQVEMAAEGNVEEVDKFVAAIARHMGSHIKGTSIQDLSPSGWQGFRIRH